jgi:TRAP-type C4-dicarboxylate transport system permease large subunit
LAIGSFTPPVGGALYVSSQIAGISIWKTVKGLIPFYIANVIVLMLITYIPYITLILPKLFGVIPF